MKSHDRPEDSGRRSFIGGAAAVGIGAAVATAVPGEALADAEPSPDGNGKGRGYRLSQHVIDYYRSAASRGGRT